MCIFFLSYKYKTLTSGCLSIPKLHRKELQVILRTLSVNNFDFFNVSGGLLGWLELKRTLIFYTEYGMKWLFGGECVCLVFARTSTLLPFVRVVMQFGRGSLLPLARHCWMELYAVRWVFVYFLVYCEVLLCMLQRPCIMEIFLCVSLFFLHYGNGAWVRFRNLIKNWLLKCRGCVMIKRKAEW
jgi:hypothetical protein